VIDKWQRINAPAASLDRPSFQGTSGSGQEQADDNVGITTGSHQAFTEPV
jgi:hypothetical protein